MEQKARIVIYDDLMMLDETETFYKDKEQLAGVAISCLRSTPDAEMVEVYVKGKLKLKFSINNRGKVKKERTSRMGGARRGAGRPKGQNSILNQVHFRVNDEMFDFLSSLNNKAAYIRAAIQEKREREGQ